MAVAGVVGYIQRDGNSSWRREDRSTVNDLVGLRFILRIGSAKSWPWPSKPTTVAAAKCVYGLTL